MTAMKMNWKEKNIYKNLFHFIFIFIFWNIHVVENCDFLGLRSGLVFVGFDGDFQKKFFHIYWDEFHPSGQLYPQALVSKLIRVRIAILHINFFV